jgi:hypothetical protein
MGRYRGEFEREREKERERDSDTLYVIALWIGLDGIGWDGIILE